jgi:thiol-disulfide isomerase/thioredoxin
MNKIDRTSGGTSGRPSRRALFAGVAALAALGGAGLAWWRLGPHEVQAGAEEGLWQHTFVRPDGGELALQLLRGKPLLVNFWATWCPPCVEELPLLDRFYRENAPSGWQVVGLAIDQPSAVRNFLQRVPLSFPVGLAGLEGTELGRSLGNLAGGLPFTVVFGSQGRIVHRKMGKVSPEDLMAWASLR